MGTPDPSARSARRLPDPSRLPEDPCKFFVVAAKDIITDEVDPCETVDKTAEHPVYVRTGDQPPPGQTRDEFKKIEEVDKLALKFARKPARGDLRPKRLEFRTGLVADDEPDPPVTRGLEKHPVEFPDLLSLPQSLGAEISHKTEKTGAKGGHEREGGSPVSGQFRPKKKGRLSGVHKSISPVPSRDRAW